MITITLQTEPTTIVVFRIWRGANSSGDPIALFPEIIADSSGHCESYEHIGQHGAADYSHVVRATRPAKPRDYASLKRELEGAPYHYRLEVRKRYTQPRAVRVAQLRRL